MANTWNTLHIFGFGSVQVISDTENKQAPASAFQAKVDAVVDNVWAGRPQGYQGQKSYHAINNFNGMFSDWLPDQAGSQSFRVQAADLNQALLDDLANAVLSYVPPTTTTTSTTSSTTKP